MGRKQLYDFEGMATTLYEELAEYPDGMTMEEIVALLNVPSRDVASKVITTLRLMLGQGDSIAVPVIREGREHFYVLSTDREELKPWLDKRARYLHQFIQTEVATLKALKNATDGRSKQGQAIRLALREAVRLEEDLSEYLDGSVI